MSKQELTIATTTATIRTDINSVVTTLKATADTTEVLRAAVAEVRGEDQGPNVAVWTEVVVDSFADRGEVVAVEAAVTHRAVRHKRNSRKIDGLMLKS